MVVVKIQSLRSVNVTLDEDIEEQKRRNNFLIKRFAEAKEQLNTMRENAAQLYNESQSLDKTTEKFSKQLDQEERKLAKTVATKRVEIAEIIADAAMVTSLREQKEQVATEIAQLQGDWVDADIDVDNLTQKFQYELGAMILFPFWKLEDELDRVQSEGDSSGEESKEQRDDNYDNYDDDGGEDNADKKVCSLIEIHFLFTGLMPSWENYLGEFN